ncbi:MAG: hypothetical protein ACI8XM_002358 [Haloarculaceae archaeon]|jgi:hypothetical protein
MESPITVQMRGDSMYERLQNLVEDYGEVQVRFDSGVEAELHSFNTDFVDEPMVKVVTKGEAHWFDAEKVEEMWIHYDYQ